MSILSYVHMRISAITVTNISRSFYLQDGGNKSVGIDTEQNYVTVTLCIRFITNYDYSNSQ